MPHGVAGCFDIEIPPKLPTVGNLPSDQGAHYEHFDLSNSGDLKSATVADTPLGAESVQQLDTLAESRTLYLRRQLVQAAEHGASLLASLGLPRLVPLDREAIGAALDRAIATLDDLDGDVDLEPWLTGYQSPHLPLDAEDDSEDDEATALESFGRGFTASGGDDAEQDDEPEDDELGDERDSGIGDIDGYHEQCGFAVAGALPWSMGGYVA